MRICGIFDENRGDNEIKQIVDRMCLTLNHGSYKSNKFVSDNFGIGCLYLDNLETDRQFIWNLEKESRVISMIGNVLDYKIENKRLFNVKTEKFLINDFAPLMYGLDRDLKKLHNFLRKLNGVFIFVIYNTNEKALTIINDKFGMQPLYYYHDKSKFIFASEVKAILCDDTVKKRINWDGWRDRFAYGYLLGTKTLFKGIYALPNASILTYKNGKMNIEEYWNYNEIEIDQKHSETYFVNQGIKFIEEAVRKWTRHLKHCIIFLSGGYDSRCIAAFVKNFTNVNFETFTTHHTQNDELYAAKIAKCLNAKNTYVPHPNNLYEKYFIKTIYLLDGACTSDRWIWIMPLVENMEKHEINLDGLAGDLLLGGATELNLRSLKSVYDDNDCALTLHYNLESNSRGMWRELNLYYYMAKPYRPPHPWYFFDGSLREKLKPKLSSILKELKFIRKNDNRINVFLIKNKTKNCISLGPNNIISVKAPCYFPFLEANLVQFALSIPPKMKIPSKRLYSKILKKAFPELMKIESTNDKPASIEIAIRIRQLITAYLPSPILEATRMIYANLKVPLLKREIDPKKVNYLLTLLNDLEIPKFINKKRLINYTYEYLNKKIDPRFFLEPIVEFCVWYNLFILNKSPENLLALQN